MSKRPRGDLADDILRLVRGRSGDARPAHAESLAGAGSDIGVNYAEPLDVETEALDEADEANDPIEFAEEDDDF